MIKYTNIQRYDGLSFKEYLQLPGASYSFLKSQKNGVEIDRQMTTKMWLGSLVDGIICEQQSNSNVNTNTPEYRAAKSIASKLVNSFGDIISACEKQVSFTGSASIGRLQLPVRGRPDFILPNHAVIDLKITNEKDMLGVIKYFQYDNQLFNYAALSGVKTGYILMYSTRLNEAKVFWFDFPSLNNVFWEDAILSFGKAV